MDRQDLRMVDVDKKEEVLEVDEQFGRRRTKRRPREDDSIPPSEDLHQVFPLEGEGIKKKKKRKFKPFCQSELMIALVSDQSYKDQYR